jgi:hypothetical protein
MSDRERTPYVSTEPVPRHGGRGSLDVIATTRTPGGRRPPKEASMINRNKRGISSAGVRVRLAIAAAVIVGGGAAGVLAVTASHGGATTVQSSAFTVGYSHTISEPKALTGAFSDWSTSPSKALVTLAEMTTMRSFAQVRVHGVTLAAQRGVVVLATKKFLVVKSANGSLHLWALSKATNFEDVSASKTGMAAMTGSDTATTTAMSTGDMNPASTVMGGSVSAVTQMATTPAKPTTITIDAGGQVITITIASSTATVTQPMTMTSTQMTQGTQPAFKTVMGVHRGDLILVAGTRSHGLLMAKIVLFAAPGAFGPAPGATATPTATPTVTPIANSTLTGSHS